MDAYTVVLAIDGSYIEQFGVSVPTFKRFRQEWWDQRIKLLVDMDSLTREQIAWAIRELDHPKLEVTMWPPYGVEYQSQREKMLAGFVHAPLGISTKWWLKVDVDSLATGRNWFDRKWFADNPAWVASSWGYTKPADQMAKLDQWANGHQMFAGTSPLELPFEAGARRCYHSRMCSWVSWYRTDWTRKLAENLGVGEVPVPSQDGLHWYTATRLGLSGKTVRMKRWDWENHSRLSTLKKRAAEIMGGE